MHPPKETPSGTSLRRSCRAMENDRATSLADNCVARLCFAIAVPQNWRSAYFTASRVGLRIWRAMAAKVVGGECCCRYEGSAQHLG